MDDDRWVAIESRISRLEAEFDNRISNLEKNLDSIRSDLNTITENILDIKAMLGKQAAFNENIKDIFATRSELNKQINDINIKLSELYEWKRAKERDDEKFWRRYNGAVSAIAVLLSFIGLLIAIIRGGKL